MNRTHLVALAIAGVLLLGLCAACGAALVFLGPQIASRTTRLMEAAATLVAATPTPEQGATPAPARMRTPSPTKTPTPAQEESEQAEEAGEASVPLGLPDEEISVLADGLLPAFHSLLETDEPRPFVRMSVRLDPEQRMLTGEEAVSIPVVDAPLHQVCFRMFANAFATPFTSERPGETWMEARVQWVDIGEGPAPPQEYSISDEGTRLVIPLDPPIPLGGKVEVGLIFTLTLGMDDGRYGLTRSLPDGRIMAYYFYPEPARIRNGWCALEPPWENGDLHQAEATHFRIRLDVPKDTEFAIGGVVRGRKETNGRVIADIVAPFARNVAFIAWPRGMADAVSAEAQQEEGSVRLNGFRFRADRLPFVQGMESAASSLELFSRSFGSYPFSELDVVEVPLRGGAAGMEASGLILIGEGVYEMAGSSSPLPSSLEEVPDWVGFVIAHEMAHQWWYGLVGNDAHTEPWLDEGLANWSAAFWVEQTQGRPAAEGVWDLLILLPYRLRLATEGDLPLNRPADEYSETDYAAIIYGKGAWMLEALRRQMGEERFLTFLRRYLEQHRFGWATGDSWKAALAAAWGSRQADAFYQKWVSGANVAEADLPPGGLFGEILRDPSMGEILRSLLEALAEMQP